MSSIVVSALYKFVTLNNHQALQQPLLSTMQNNGIRGTLLLAAEGINGTVAGSRQAIDTLLAWLNADPRLNGIVHKESYVDEMPFNRTKVKLKKEIVTLGVDGIDPTQVVGTYVKPRAWNALITDPEVVVVDTRNSYEVQIGTFKNAINPNTNTFREFPQYVKEQLDPAKHKKVAMFCTGGIRCEKSTAYLKTLGFEQVYHLEGGILKYLEEVPQEESTWQGECFVFDERISVDHALNKGAYDQCHACRKPILEADKQSNKYQQGVSCHHCYDTQSDRQRQRFEEREKQARLSADRGERHIGADASEVIEQRRLKKQQVKSRQRHKTV